MAAPTVSWLANTGTEGSPVWSAISPSHTIFFTGPDTTASVLDPVQIPTSGTKFPEELWWGSAGIYTQVSTYQQNIASATNTNVLAIQFDTNPTSTAPELHAWDNTSRNSTAKEILAGTSGTSNNSWLRAGITASNVLPSAGAGSLPSGWTTQTASTTTFQIKGDTYFQTAAAAITAGRQFRFVPTSFIPNDAGTGTTGHDPVMTVKYTYT